MGISSAGIGSGLDVEGLVAKLMAAESAPLTKFDVKATAAQAKIASYGQLSGAIGAFQGALSSLSSPSAFSSLSGASSNEDVLKATVRDGAVPGKYKVNVTQLAQAQSLNSPGRASTSAAVATTTAQKISFQFGAVTGTYGMAGGALAPSVANIGIPKGALSINGTAIATSGATTSADELAAAINEQSDKTGVTASAGATTTSASLFGGSGSPVFGNVKTGAGESYALVVGDVSIAAQGPGTAAGNGVTAAGIDATLQGTNATTQALAAAGITFSGSAADGTLRFTAADGSNLTVAEQVTGAGVTGGLAGDNTANAGRSITASATVTLNSPSGSPVTIGGSNPALAGFAAGTGGSYLAGASFDLDASRTIGSVALDAGPQSLASIRDAINKANVGVSASIVSDGSANPYHLVLTSNSTGEKSTMKITVTDADGNAGDPALAALLNYDPAGAQSLTQTSAALSTKATVNGLAVTSDNNSISGAIDGISLDVQDVGTATVNVSRDSKTVTDAINGFVKAYNTLNSTISGLTSYDAATKKAGALQGDFTVRAVQSQLRAQLGTAVQGIDGLTTLSQIGITFQKDGSLALDTTKLNTAMTNHPDDIAGLFAAVGKASDGTIKVDGSSAKTKAGNYGVVVSQMAERGSLKSAAKLDPVTTIGPGTTWSVTLNQTDPTTASKVQNITIPAGNYGPKEFAAVLRSAINGQADFAGAGDAVDAEVDDQGFLTLSSSRYGSASNIALASVTGSTVASLFGTNTSGAGKDVAGTIGGVQGTGVGQTLTGAAGSAVDGLKLTIDTGESGDRGSVSFSKGYADQLKQLATSFTGADGIIGSKTKSLNDTITSIQKQRDKFNDHLTSLQARYRAQFTALDTMLQSMQSTSSYLTQQLAALAANSSS